MGSRGGKRAVEEELGSGQVGGGGIGFAAVVYEVSPDSHSDAVGIRFLGTIVGADA
jgi:hypothetical protein